MISVLYVDDERDLCEISRIFLEREGEFQVGTAISAQEALDLPHLTSYDVIISDYSMPGMDGIAFLKAVRDRFGDIPFILFSGRGREEVVIEAINNGADFYIQKGGDPKSQFAELTHKIRQAARRKQAERFLRESERRLADIINFLPDATFAIDKNGCVIAWNHAIEEMTGVPAHKILGKGDYAYSIPFYGSKRPILIDLLNEPEDRFSHLYSNISRNGSSLMSETDLATPRGRTISVLIRACPLYNEDGVVTGAIESIRDITESKKAENSLRTSEEKFRALVELSLEGIIITDFSGTLLFANHAAGTIVEIPDIDKVIAGKNVMDFIAPESKADVFRDITQVSQGIDAYLVSYKLITAKQREVWVECVGKKIQYENAPAMLVSMRNVTERKLAEATIRDSESKFSTVFQHSPVSLTLVSATRGTFTDINNAFMRSTGFTRDAVIGRTSEELGLFIDPAEYQDFVSTLQQHGEVHGMELKCRMKSGKIRICQFSSAIIVMDGKPHILSTVEDVTERKNAEESLHLANRQLNLLTGITRHDILNNITVLNGYIHLTEEDPADPRVPEFLQKMESTVGDIRAQIEFTRTYQALGTHEPQWLDLPGILQSIKVPEEITLIVVVENISVFASPIFERVFFNLLDNSIGHGERVTRIQVSSRKTGDDLLIVWEDNGVGIPEKDKEHIFERGFGKNTGLGLFLAREVLSLTGIIIRETGMEGTGARFEIVVPQSKYR